MLDVDEARRLVEGGKVRLNLFGKIQLAYVNWKIKYYAKQTITEISVDFLSWKVSHILEENGYKIIGPLPEYLNPGILPDVSTIISWKDER